MKNGHFKEIRFKLQDKLSKRDPSVCYISKGKVLYHQSITFFTAGPLRTRIPSASEGINANKMDEYILIFRHEDGTKIASPEQMQIWMKQTMDWIGTIAAQNKFQGGTGLPFDSSRVVWGSNKVVTNGPFGDIKETIGGFITVKADSIEEAVEFAKGSPVLQGEGNSVEVRRIAKNDGVH
jgi:hypothetical protein